MDSSDPLANRRLSSSDFHLQHEETDGVEMGTLGTVGASVTSQDMQAAAAPIAGSRGHAFAAAGKDFLKKSAGLGLAILSGIPLIVGYIAYYATLVASTAVKDTGRLILGGIGYGIGSLVDAATGSTDKAGTGAKIASFITDGVAAIIGIGYYVSLLAYGLGEAGLKLGLDQSQSQSLAKKIGAFDNFIKQFFQQIDKKIESLLKMQPKEVSDKTLKPVRKDSDFPEDPLESDFEADFNEVPPPSEPLD